MQSKVSEYCILLLLVSLNIRRLGEPKTLTTTMWNRVSLPSVHYLCIYLLAHFGYVRIAVLYCVCDHVYM